MNKTQLSPDERSILLRIARQAIEKAVDQEPIEPLDLPSLTAQLQAAGASFVTLTNMGELRGCIGALQAYQPLVLDVQEHAIAAAMEDYRFPPVSREEVPLLEIEISRLTPSYPLEYSNGEDLLNQLRPGVDGVILRNGIQRATFLPQVWEQVPNPEDFLTHLCLKMGAPGDLWRRQLLRVETYQVEEFREKPTKS